MNQVPSTDRCVLLWAAAPPVEPDVPVTECVWLDSAPVVPETVWVCALSLDDDAAMPVVFGLVLLIVNAPSHVAPLFPGVE